ncbi:MAG: hypothetical protein KCHDKBKB_00373 [Elusimicrobia bacterium]|nr:hypothetical protein [Elusimicrobiota bacterium]
MSRRIMGLFLFLGLFSAYVHMAAPSVTTGDSGEFITAAATLSLPHAPSFPLYMLSAKAFMTALPWGSFPYRCNVFSALTAALSGVLIFLLLVSMGGGTWGSLLTTVLVAVSMSYWENSLVAEVFSLNTLIMIMLLCCLAKQAYALFFFLLGLGLGNHQILLFVAPVFLVSLFPNIQDCSGPYGESSSRHAFWPGSRFSLRENLGPGQKIAGATTWKVTNSQGPLSFHYLRTVGLWVFLFLLGLSIYLTLPIRSSSEPPLNWGQPTTIEKLSRTFLRKDYGSLKLALGDTPDRNMSNTARHLKNFYGRLCDEIPWPVLWMAFGSLIFAMIKMNRWAWTLFILFLFTGPFFYLLGNLPFNAQSDGIIGRFMIGPTLALLLSLPVPFQKRSRSGVALLAIFLLLTLKSNFLEAKAFRSSTLVLDYGRAMLRTLPEGSTLFLDGGDDAFYSLAMLRYVMNKRADVSIHDRGGLIFKNPYGPDFRSLTKEQKQERRRRVETSALSRGAVYYSTMDRDVLPGYRLVQDGILMKVDRFAVAKGLSKTAILRSLYPLTPAIYRMRALGPFFPFMEGRYYLSQGNWAEALRYFRRAGQMGRDVDWLKNNLGMDYAQSAYQKLMSQELALSETIYLQWIAFDPMNLQAHSNLGVVYERSNRLQDAVMQYEKTARLFPDAVDPVFNLAVLAWKKGDWPSVVNYLEEVIKRKPDHLQAQGYLKVAREKLKASMK